MKNSIVLCFILLSLTFSGCFLFNNDAKINRQLRGVWEAKIFTVDNTDWLDGGTTLTLEKNKDFTFKHGTLTYSGVWRESGNNLTLIYSGNRGCISQNYTEENYQIVEISSKEMRLSDGSNLTFIADKK